MGIYLLFSAVRVVIINCYKIDGDDDDLRDNT